MPRAARHNDPSHVGSSDSDASDVTDSGSLPCAVAEMYPVFAPCDGKEREGGGEGGRERRRGGEKREGRGRRGGNIAGERGGFLVRACGVLRRHFCMASNADFSARSAGANARAL